MTKLKIVRGFGGPHHEPHLGFYLALQASSRRVQARLDEIVMTPFFLEMTKFLYKIWPTKWFFCTAISISFESLGM